MNRKCNFCSSVIDIKKHGLTKYCSSLCRNKDYYLKKQNLNLDDEKVSKNKSTEKLSNTIDDTLNEQNSIGNDIVSNKTSQWEENNLKSNEIMIPETYKAILDEKGKNYDLQSKINMLELRNEALIKSNQDLESEINRLNNEIEELENEDEKENGQIFGMPNTVFQNVLVEILTPHATNIISGLMKKKTDNA
jgi:chromosome segregation ATPase